MRKIKEVTLQFFEDFHIGEYGLSHHNTIDRGFNAFYTGPTIFHDVFEHAHEGEKYFTGDAFMNVGGELAASGACWYFYEMVGGIREIGSSIYSFQENVASTGQLISEAISNGYCDFGDTLVSHVPKQRPVDNGDLEWIIDEVWKDARKAKYGGANAEEWVFSKNYKQSVTRGKIADLHRYGYRRAEMLIPHNGHNCDALYGFIDFWNTFCKNLPAEELMSFFKSITFKIYKEKEKIKWTATLNSADRFYVKDFKITEKTNPDFLSMDDFYILENY